MDSPIKRRGRPRIFTDTERKDRRTTYMLNKEWYCYVCNTGKNYTLSGKHCHQKSIKHSKNIEAINKQYRDGNPN